MNNDELVGIELSDMELAAVQGGGIFGDIWNGVKKATSWAKKAAKDVYKWATGDGSGVVALGVAIGTAALALERKDRA